MHSNTVRFSETMLEALLRRHLIAVSTREAAQFFTLPGQEIAIPEFGKGDYGRTELEKTAADLRNKPEVSEIIAGKVNGRTRESDITCMLNPLGLGLQFSAAAATVYELATEKGIARELPTEWFSD